MFWDILHGKQHIDQGDKFDWSQYKDLVRAAASVV